MSGNPLDRLRPVGQRPKVDPTQKGIAPAWVGPCLRTSGEAFSPSLILRNRDGRVTALSYSYLTAVRLEPGGSIEIDFVGHAVTVQGVRLAAVFEALAGHRAWELSESTSQFDEGGDDPSITSIAIVPTQER